MLRLRDTFCIPVSTRICMYMRVREQILRRTRRVLKRAPCV